MVSRGSVGPLDNLAGEVVGSAVDDQIFRHSAPQLRHGHAQALAGVQLLQQEVLRSSRGGSAKHMRIK